jgi:ribosomal protein S18 acetylase RimI-like enzyme
MDPLANAPAAESLGRTDRPGKNIAVSFRPLTDPAEADICAQMMSDSDPWRTLGRDVATSRGAIFSPEKETYLAVVDGMLAGFITLNMHGAFVGYIQSICVAPTGRGQGVGTALIAYAETRIFRDSPNVFMCVSDFNPDAQRLYERLGYQVIGELRDYLVPGHAEILLRKTIGPLQTFRQGAPVR